ncbi:hypothetical protein EKG38_01230 [Shewanella canadensis]|uniref:Uncharacterized protein n=1 Tax=Shewanella canadensis TaxID=271096 RepID=A0A431WYV8_9GAMM|nr:hypothetical protein [Shewanella canadensis]RTR40572.1 hypothetical protein EKG38_01230 [Shewanella canadensis]
MTKKWILSLLLPTIGAIGLFIHPAIAAEAIMEYCDNCSVQQMESIVRAKFKYNRSCPYAEKELCREEGYKEHHLFISNSSHTEVMKYQIKHGKYFLYYQKVELTADESEYFSALVELRQDLLDYSNSGESLFK